MQPGKETPSGLKLRKMTAKDLREIMTIELASFKKPWTEGMFESELRNPVSSPFVVVKDEGGAERIVAYIIYWIIHGEAHILTIAVAPEYRRSGIARLLMLEVISRMRRNLVYEVYLEVRVSNKNARDLYEKLGFKESFIRTNYYGDEDAIVMSLAL